MADKKHDISLAALHDLLAPGLRWEMSENDRVNGYLVPVFELYRFDLVLWTYPGSRGLNEILITADEIRDESYKDHFRVRIIAAIERLKAMPLTD